MNKKRIITLSILSLALFIVYQIYIFTTATNNALQSIYLVPEDAVYIIETQKPIDNWEEISNHEIWKHLQKNDYFSELTESINNFDLTFRQQKGIFDFIGNRELLVSAHMYKPKYYDFFYVVDLQKMSRLNILKANISSLIDEDYKVSKRIYHEHEIIEVYDTTERETLYLSFIENQLIASYTHTLVEASIDQYQEPVIGRDLNFIEINKSVESNDLFRLYFQYAYLDEFSTYFSNKPTEIIRDLSENLLFSGFNFEFKKENIVEAKGYTNVNYQSSTYLKALQNSGTATRTIQKIAPLQTAFYLGLTFNSFAEFYENFEIIQKENKEQFNVYLDGKEKIENFLKIELQKNFFNWIGDEIALIHLQSTISKSKKDVALILKTSDIESATDNLTFILSQIKKKTPVKFKQLAYKEHFIRFMDVKGFFDILLGSSFNEIEKPYFTFIDDCVVFSNNPNTLKQIISDFIDGKTLGNSDEFNSFNQYFDKESSIYMYINTPLSYNSMYPYFDSKTRQKVTKNKEFITCFSQMGLQLTPKDNLFKSNLVVKYTDPETLKNASIFESFEPVEIHKPIAIKKKDPTAIFNISQINPSDLSADEFESKFNNGKTYQIVQLKDGLKHGRFKEYYKNGKLKITGKFYKDKQSGLWKAYDSNGELISKKRF